MDHDNSGVESLPSDHFDINSIIDDNGYDSFPADSWSWTKIFVGIFLVFVILVSIFGNLLVCVAVGYDRRLRRLGNFFIVSLAIADLCVGALVMTFALANDLLEYWPFGPELCEIWIAFDISGSTCSIINLCAIALDRFVHIKDPMRYNRWMNRRIVGGAVTMIWVISGGLSFIPIALGWHRPEPIPLNSVNSSPRIGTKLNEAEKAILSQLFAASNDSLSQHNGTSMPTASVPTHHRILHHAHKLNQSLSIISLQIPSPMSTSHISGQNPVSDALLGPHSAKQHLELPDPGGHTLIPLPQCALDLTPSYAVVSSIISFYVPCLVMVYLYIKLYKICQKHVKSIKSMARYQPVMVAEHLPSGPTKTPKNMKNNRSNARNNKEKNQNNTTTNGQGTANSIDGNNNSRKFQKKSIESEQLATIQKQSNHSNQMHHQQQYVQQQQQQQQNHSQSGTNEHKAAITLGIIMGTFLACWMPFFCMNILAAYCKSCISPMVFKVLTWLGYFNSSLNPAIYSIFNTEFRDAFRRILVRGFMANDPERCVSRLLPCREKRNLSNSQSGQSSSGPVPAGNGNSRQLSNANKNLQQNENFERKQETRTVSVHRETAPTDSTAKASSHRHELPEQNIQLTAPQNRNKSSDIDVSSDSGHESHDNDKCITNNETALNKSRKLENSKDATAVTSCLKNSEHCLIGVVVNSSTIDNETIEDKSDGSLTKDIVHRQNDGISVPDTQSDLVGVTQHPEQQQQQQLKSNRFSLRFVRPSKSPSSKSKVECRQTLKQTQQYQSLDQTDLKSSNDTSVRPSLEYLSKQFSSLDIDPISPVKESCEPHSFPVTISTLPDIPHQHLTSSPPSHHHSQQPHSIRTEL